MEYAVIDEKTEIKIAQNLFSKIIRDNSKNAPIQVKKINDIPNHSVLWFEDLEFWIDTERLLKMKNGVEENYFWNACGIKKPKGITDELDITVQLGVDPENFQKRAAIFVKDALGRIYLTHTCLVNKGGNKKRSPDKLTIQKFILENINKKFEKKYILSKERIVIGCLNSDNFIRMLAEFVHEIHRLKKEYIEYI